MPQLQPLPQSITLKGNDSTGDEEIIYQSTISDIFQYGAPPYIIIGETTSGKSTMLYDLLYQKAEQATNIYYFSSTEPQLDDPLCSLLKIFKRTATLQNFINVWDEIVTKGDCYNNINNDSGTQIGLNILQKIMEPELFTNFYTKLNSYLDNVMKHYYANNSNTNSALSSKVILKNEIIYKNIFNIIKENPDLFNSLPHHQKLFIQSFCSERQKNIVLFDDVTSVIQNISSSNKIITSKQSEFNGKSESKVYLSLLIDILTRGRHYNSIICLFVHNLKIFGNAKGNLTNAILIGEGAVNEYIRQQSVIPSYKKYIQQLREQLKIYPYSFIYAYTSDSLSIKQKNISNIKISYARAKCYNNNDSNNIIRYNKKSIKFNHIFETYLATSSFDDENENKYENKEHLITTMTSVTTEDSNKLKDNTPRILLPRFN